jgi:hypothetical protein
VLVVAQLGAVVGQRQVLAEHLLLVGRVVLRAQHGQQDRPGVPVDVEGVGVLGGAAPRQHVPPPGVGLRDVDADVVGHDVEHEAHPALVHGGDERAPGVLAPALARHPGRVDHVVAVVGARPGLQQRGRVERARAQVVEVGQQVQGVGERLLRRELDPVGRCRWCHVRFLTPFSLCSRHVTTRRS